MQDKYNQFTISKRVTQSILGDLNKNDKLILITLVSYLSKNRQGVFTCYPSHKTIVNLTGTSLSTVSRSISKIIKCGYMSVEKRSNKTDVYTWLGISDKEREINTTPKTSRSQEEWKAIRKGLIGVERLEEEAKQARVDLFNDRGVKDE